MHELIDCVDRECAVLTQSGTARVSPLRTGFAHATRREPLAGSAATTTEFVISGRPAFATMTWTADLGPPGAAFTARAPTTVVLIERSLPLDASSTTGATDDLDS